MIDKVKFICRAYNILPQKNKGQNFLVSEKVLNEIVQAADLQPQDVVLEVGPGLGVLTEILVKKAKKVLSVELDKKLFSFLQDKFKSEKGLALINQDILNWHPQDYIPGNYKIVANLPYNISSSFLKKFLTAGHKPQSLVLLLQKEVAQRICAKPGEMSLLSISVQLYAKPEIVNFVGKNNFWPKPEVDSAIIRISQVKNSQEMLAVFGEISEKQFWQVVRIGFSARRKQLANNLAAGLKISNIEAKKALLKANLSELIRAQNLSVNDWINLAKIVKNNLN